MKKRSIYIRATDHKNRDLAKLNEDICFGKEGKKVIW